MAEKEQLTKAGKAKLEEELYDLVHVVSDEVKRQLAEARAQGDLSENADYDAARARQAEVEGRIKYLQNILANAVIIDEGSKKSNRVALGSTVTVKIVDENREAKYKIVGTVESDPFKGLISNSCPLGESLLGKQVGDIVEIKGKITYKVEIAKIENI